MTVGRDSTKTYTDRRDWVRLRGYQQCEAETDYTTALTSETTTHVMDQCYPETSSSTVSSSSSSDPDVHIDHHHNLPDGALTGGYCARKWWC